MFQKLGGRIAVLSILGSFIATGVVIWFLSNNSAFTADTNDNTEEALFGRVPNQTASGEVSNLDGFQSQDYKNKMPLIDNVLDSQQGIGRTFTSSDLKKSAYQYKQDIAQLEKSQATLKTINEALLNNEQTLKKLQEEWERHALQFDKYENDKRSAQAAASYEFANADKAEALLEQLKRRDNNERPDYPTGMAPQVVNRVQETTGISPIEIENLMNQ